MNAAAMPMSRDDDENDVYRVETVPPPPGEHDAYSAPTKIGAMPVGVLDAMKQAALSGAPLKPMALPNQAPKPVPLELSEVSESSGVITRIRHEEDDEPGINDNATRVVGAATAPVVTPVSEPAAVRSEPPATPAAVPSAVPTPVFVVAAAVPVVAAATPESSPGKQVVAVPRSGGWWPLLVMVFVVVALSALFATGLYLDR